jgi:hypothetical protein
LALPNLFLIGAPKAATTSLAAALALHPAISIPTMKEPDFFSWDDEYRKGLPYLLRTHYRDLHTPVRLDASVTYLASDSAAARIAEDLDPSHHRFLVVLRDPVDRTYSNYWECRSAGFERASFEEAISADADRKNRYWAGRYPQSHLAASRYGTHLQRWFDAFPREAFLILRFEEVKYATAQTLRRIYEFAGVDPNLGSKELPLTNQASNPRWSAVSLISRTPEPVKALVRRIAGQRLIHSTVGALDKVNIAGREIPPIDPETSARVRDLLRPEVLVAEDLTGLDLTDWR